MKLSLILTCALVSVSARAATITLNESVLVNTSPMRFGVNVSTSNNYDSGQLFRNLLFTVNPGFEGYLQQEIIGCISGSATTCTNYYQWDQAPANYWAGATATFCCSASTTNANSGQTRSIVSSTTSAGSVGPTYTFSSPLPQPVTADDYFTVVRQVDSTGSSIPQWILTGAATGETTNIPPGSAGVQALSLPAGSCASAYADGTGTHDFVMLPLGETFGFSLKTVAISGAPLISVSVSRLGGIGGGVLPSLGVMLPGPSWTTESLAFAGAEITGITYGTLQVRLCNSGTGTAYVDDADLERTSNLNPANTSAYRDEVVASLTAIHPGSLRFWDYQLGETLADWTNPLFGRHVQASLQGQNYVTATSGTNAGSTAQGLMDFLGLCEVMGAQAWVTIPVSWPASDYSNLIDFLAGGPATAYGAKRITNGHAAPYTSTLGHIYIEFGNEPWNSVFGGINMPNFSYALNTGNGMLSYGHWSATAMSAMKGNPNYSPSFSLVANMQAASTYEFTSHILPNNRYLDAVSVAPYIGTGQLNNTGTLDAEWNPDTAFTWGDSNDSAGDSGNGWTYAYVHAGSTPVYVYEDNENQVNGTAPTATIQNHSSSFMAGTVITQQMLEHLKILGPDAPQHLWSLAQDEFKNSSSVNIPLYGVMKEAGGEWAGDGNYIQRPTALALQIANDSIIGPEYSSAVTDADTYSTGVSNGFAPEANVPFEFTYCFMNGSNRSCVLANTDPANSHTFTLAGADVPTSVTTRVLSMAGGTIDSCNNEAAVPCVSIVTTSGVPLPGGSIVVAPGALEAIDFVSGGSSGPGVPVISAVSSSGVTGSSATITWTTDQPSSSQVEFGTTMGYGSYSALSSSLVTAHSVTLTGLTPGTTYDYAAMSGDAAGASVSGNFSFATPANAPVSAIAPVGGAHGNTGASATPTSLSINYASHGGNTIVVVCALGNTASSIGSITDNGSAWALRALSSNGTAIRSEIWSTNAGGSVASSSFTIKISGGAPASCALEEYSGVLSLGPTATNQGTSGTWSVGVTATEANDFVVAGVGANSYFGYTNAVGTIRQAGAITSNAGPDYVEMSLLDNTAATASAITCSVNTGSAPWANAALELRPIGAAPVISAVSSIGVSSTSATITWTTDQPSSSEVEFGATTGYGSFSALSSSLVTAHSVTLSGLTPGTNYDYAAISGNAAGASVSGNFSFATPVNVPTSVIAPVGGAHGNTGASATPTSLSIHYVSGGGNTIVAVCALGNTASSIGSITDNGSVWALRAFSSNGTAIRSEIWSTNAGGSVASSSFTIKIAGGGAPASCALEEYSGVLSLGPTTTNQGVSGTWSVGMTIQEANDVMVAGLGANSYYGYTNAMGTIRQAGAITSNAGPDYVEMSLLDSTSATASAITCSVNTGSAPWANAALELRPIPAAPVISGVSATGVTATSATITWTTDQTSSSQVEFGTSAGYGSFSALSSSLVTAHSVTLTGLTPGTAYDYAAMAGDAAGTSVSGNFSFATPVSVPIIGAVSTSGITTTSATITWTTDQPSSSQVEFGTTTGYGTLSIASSALVTAHSVTLTGLTPGTTYNYAAMSGDSAGTSVSANFTFPTLTLAPVISATGSSGVTPTSATITWTTDQPSSSQVEFGTTTGYGSISAFGSALVTAHSVTLTGLSPNATYDYAVISGDAAGTSVSGNFTFQALPVPPSAVVTPVGGAHGNTGVSAAAATLSINYASSTGNTVVAVCALGNTSASIGSITDSGSVWALRAFVNNGTAIRSEIWSTNAGGSVASSSFTINIAGGTPASCALEEYSGVLSLGPTAANQATSGTWTVGMTTQEANDVVVAGLGANSYYGYTLTNGVSRQAGGLTSNPGNYVEMTLCDNKGATVTSVNCSSASGSAHWAALALELR